MKKGVLLLCLACPFLVAAFNPSMDDARAMAYKIYTTIGQTVDKKAERLTPQDYIEMYGQSSNGIPLYDDHEYPNDLYLLNGGKGSKTLFPSEYFPEIVDFVKSKETVVFRYEIVSIAPHEQAQMRENEDVPKFADVTIQKEWIIDGKKSYRITDVVEIDLRLKCVSTITNDFVSLQDIQAETMDDMMAIASSLYNRARYDEAAAMYTRVTQKYPDSDDAWYYLGVMYFKMQGVGQLSKKQRLQKAYDCWKHSNLNKAQRAISYITDGRE